MRLSRVCMASNLRNISVVIESSWPLADNIRFFSESIDASEIGTGELLCLEDILPIRAVSTDSLIYFAVFAFAFGGSFDSGGADASSILCPIAAGACPAVSAAPC